MVKLLEEYRTVLDACGIFVYTQIYFAFCDEKKETLGGFFASEDFVRWHTCIQYLYVCTALLEKLHSYIWGRAAAKLLTDEVAHLANGCAAVLGVGLRN